MLTTSRPVRVFIATVLTIFRLHSGRYLADSCTVRFCVIKDLFSCENRMLVISTYTGRRGYNDVNHRGLALTVDAICKPLKLNSPAFQKHLHWVFIQRRVSALTPAIFNASRVGFVKHKHLF